MKSTPTLPLASRIVLPHATLEAGQLTLIAGPCAVESHAQLMAVAGRLKAAGVSILRGGAFKPRTLPSSFQGLGEEGLRLLRAVADELSMAVVTEALDTRQVDLVSRYADILQIGARNMQNFPLLREAGKTGKPILLKRGMGATLDEFVGAAQYVLQEGNSRVIFCERGIRTFSDTSRFTLDLAAVLRLKAMGNPIVIVDPSHSAGAAALVAPLARAAIAAGADGVIVEVHPHPETALSDKDQALLPGEFEDLAQQLRAMHEILGLAQAKIK